MTETLYDGRHVRLLTIIDEGIGRAWETAMGVSLPMLDGVQTAGSFGDMLETEESRS